MVDFTRAIPQAVGSCAAFSSGSPLNAGSTCRSAGAPGEYEACGTATHAANPGTRAHGRAPDLIVTSQGDPARDCSFRDERSRRTPSLRPITIRPAPEQFVPEFHDQGWRGEDAAVPNRGGPRENNRAAQRMLRRSPRSARQAGLSRSPAMNAGHLYDDRSGLRKFAPQAFPKEYQRLEAAAPTSRSKDLRNPVIPTEMITAKPSRRSQSKRRNGNATAPTAPSCAPARGEGTWRIWRAGPSVRATMLRISGASGAEESRRRRLKSPGRSRRIDAARAETAIVDLLKGVPALFTGAGTDRSSRSTPDFDPLGRSVAGQPGLRMVDELPFNPAAPTGPIR